MLGIWPLSTRVLCLDHQVSLHQAALVALLHLVSETLRVIQTLWASAMAAAAVTTSIHIPVKICGFSASAFLGELA